MESIHDRMPVILDPADEKHWLNSDLKPEDALNLLQPYNADNMQAYQVSTMVNSPANNTPELIEHK
jgi:putative SOS response-associated peptidase YedK